MDGKTKRTLIRDLSDSRAFLQGMAMLWVILFHLLPSLRFLGGGRRDILLRAVLGIGYGGCDIFLLLSGFGLSKSLQKDGNALRFYGRRARKIAPSYYLFMIVFLLFLYDTNSLDIRAAVGNLFFVGFWHSWPNQFNWYVQANMAVYLLAPVIHWVYNSAKNRNWALGGLTVFYAALILLYQEGPVMIAVSRMWVLFLGFWLGRHSYEELPWKAWYPAAALGACVLGGFILYKFQPYVSFQNGLHWYPLILLAPGLCVLAAWARPWVLKIPGYPWLDKLICRVGICSFEIYLIQGFFIEWVKPPFQSRLAWCLVGVAAVVLGMGFHDILAWAGKRKKSKTAV